MSKGKEPWDKKVEEAIAKFFRALKSIWRLLYKILYQAMDSVIFLVTLITKLIVNPTATIAMCIAFLCFVTVLTAFQWWQIGFWIGQMLGMPTVLGWGLGTIGMAAGLFLNIEELSPELHKISESLARAFDKMNVKPDHVVEPDNIKDRLANWYSYDMALAKKGRLLSYAVETAIVIGYVFGTGLTLQAIVIAFVSLTCPEVAIKYLSSKTSLYGTASALATEIEEGTPVKNFGGSPQGGGGKPQGGGGQPKGGMPMDMMDAMGGSGGRKDRL